MTVSEKTASNLYHAVDGFIGSSEVSIRMFGEISFSQVTIKQY